MGAEAGGPEQVEVVLHSLLARAWLPVPTKQTSAELEGRAIDDVVLGMLVETDSDVDDVDEGLEDTREISVSTA